MARYIIRYDYSDAFSSREQAINFYAVNHIQRQNDEVVRILNEQEEKEFKAEIIEDCKNQLLLHLAEVIYRQNDYPIRAVPQTTILSLPALMNVTSEVNNWKREFACGWYKRGNKTRAIINKEWYKEFEKEWKEQGKQ